MWRLTRVRFSTLSIPGNGECSFPLHVYTLVLAVKTVTTVKTVPIASEGKGRTDYNPLDRNKMAI